MKAGFLLVLFFALTATARAQTRQTIRIKPGDDAKALLLKELYRYPQFVYGKAYFSNGDVSGAKMNYDLLKESIEFINEKEDTLSIDNEDALTYVSIGADTFYHSGGFLEKITGTDKVTLAVRRKLSFADAQKIGGLGIPTSTANIESKESFTDKRYKLAINEELVFTKQNLYYIRKGNEPFVAATKKNLLKLYPARKKDIENFLSKHNINLSSEPGLLQLINFLKTL